MLRFANAHFDLLLIAGGFLTTVVLTWLALLAAAPPIQPAGEGDRERECEDHP